MAEEKKADTSRKVIVALKNNILYDLVLAPNVEVELSDRAEVVFEYRI